MGETAETSKWFSSTQPWNQLSAAPRFVAAAGAALLGLAPQWKVAYEKVTSKPHLVTLFTALFAAPPLLPSDVCFYLCLKVRRFPNVCSRQKTLGTLPYNLGLSVHSTLRWASTVSYLAKLVEVYAWYEACGRMLVRELLVRIIWITEFLYRHLFILCSVEGKGRQTRGPVAGRNEDLTRRWNAEAPLNELSLLLPAHTIDGEPIFWRWTV